jgi:putative nucleotidyltransferase with HDIG domain
VVALFIALITGAGGIMDANGILKRLENIEELPTLPAIALEVNRMLQDEDISVKQVAKTIETDQAMVPKILKLVNSAFFGLRSKISSISHAIMILGFNTVRNAAVSVSIIDTFSGKEVAEGFDVRDLWRHSIGVATTSRYLAHELHLPSPEDAFTGGLLHDMGKVVLSQYLPDLFKKVWTSAKENRLSFYQAEKKEIPIDHAQIGAFLSKRWQLPPYLTDAIRYHHSVSKTAQDVDLLMVVHVANILVNSLQADSNGSVDISAIYPDAANSMMDQLKSAGEWYPKLAEEIEAACRFFLNGEG